MCLLRIGDQKETISIRTETYGKFSDRLKKHPVYFKKYNKCNIKQCLKLIKSGVYDASE